MAAGLFAGLQQTFDIASGHGNATELTPSQFAEFTPYIQFARAAYCDPKKITGWNCGAACNALPGFQPNLTGGDGKDIQFFFVGYWPAQSSVVVAHQGTNPKHILAVRTDIELNRIHPDNTLFPGIPTVEVHEGFANEHKKTANRILAAVRKLMAEHLSTNVILIGHSLGGALAELDSLFMKLNLPAGTTVEGVTFGTPRVGNRAWATFFNSQVSNFTRMNNKRDPIPTFPLNCWGFKHPSKEIHIEANGNAIVYLGK